MHREPVESEVPRAPEAGRGKESRHTAPLESECWKLVWQERVARKAIPKHSKLFWILVAAIVLTTEWALVRDSGLRLRPGIPPFAIYCGLIALLGILPGWNCARLLQVGEDLRYSIKDGSVDTNRWYVTQLSKVYDFRRHLVAFLLVGVPLTYVLVSVTQFFQYQKPWFGVGVCNWFALFAFILFCFLACHYFAFAVGVMQLIDKFSKMPVNVMVHQHSSLGLHAIGRVMLELALQMLLLVTLSYVGIWISPLPMKWPVFASALSAAVVVLSFFFLPQIRVHRALVAAKHQRLRDLIPQLEEALAEFIRDPTVANGAKLERLESIQNRFNKMSEWPFDLGGALQLIFTSLLPVALALIEKLRTA